MKTKMVITSKAETLDSYGQAIIGSATTIATVVGWVDTAERDDKSVNSGQAVIERTNVVIPWYPNLKAGYIVTLTDGSDTTVYQIESIQDDRNKHRQLRLGLTRSEEAI
jgi:hypothetical protein